MYNKNVEDEDMRDGKPVSSQECQQLSFALVAAFQACQISLQVVRELVLRMFVKTNRLTKIYAVSAYMYDYITDIVLKQPVV